MSKEIKYSYVEPLHLPNCSWNVAFQGGRGEDTKRKDTLAAKKSMMDTKHQYKFSWGKGKKRREKKKAISPVPNGSWNSWQTSLLPCLHSGAKCPKQGNWRWALTLQHVTPHRKRPWSCSRLNSATELNIWDQLRAAYFHVKHSQSKPAKSYTICMQHETQF